MKILIGIAVFLIAAIIIPENIMSYIIGIALIILMLYGTFKLIKWLIKFVNENETIQAWEYKREIKN